MQKGSVFQCILVAMFMVLAGILASCDTGTSISLPTGIGDTGSTIIPALPTNTSSNGNCCADCICRNDPVRKTSSRGSYQTRSYSLPRGATPSSTTVYYPTSGQAPFAGIVFCPPFTATQSMFRAWGPWFASHGIVLVTMGVSANS